MLYELHSFLIRLIACVPFCAKLYHKTKTLHNVSTLRNVPPPPPPCALIRISARVRIYSSFSHTCWDCNKTAVGGSGSLPSIFKVTLRPASPENMECFASICWILTLYRCIYPLVPVKNNNCENV